MGTSVALGLSAAPTNLSMRGMSFDVPGEEVRRQDVLAVKAPARMREMSAEGNGPIILEMLTYRYHAALDVGTRPNPAQGGGRQCCAPEHVRSSSEGAPVGHIMGTEDELKRSTPTVRALVQQASEFATPTTPTRSGRALSDVVQIVCTRPQHPCPPSLDSPRSSRPREKGNRRQMAEREGDLSRPVDFLAPRSIPTRPP